MSKYFRTLFLISIVAFISSCKKGENDPFLSLQSRKARMHGDWNITAFEYSEKTTHNNGSYTEITELFDSNVITLIQKEYSETSSTTEYDTVVIVVDYVKYNFNKKGTWTKEFMTTSMSTDQYQDGTNMVYDTTITVSEITESGDWSFLGAVKDEFKNKERIIMNVLNRQHSEQLTNYHTEISFDDTLSVVNIGDQTNSVSDYYSGEKSSILEIDQLKRKEMIFIEKRRNSGETTITPYQGISTTSEDADFQSDSKLTLSRI